MARSKRALGWRAVREPDSWFADWDWGFALRGLAAHHTGVLMQEEAAPLGALGRDGVERGKPGLFAIRFVHFGLAESTQAFEARVREFAINHVEPLAIREIAHLLVAACNAHHAAAIF